VQLELVSRIVLSGGHGFTRVSREKRGLQSLREGFFGQETVHQLQTVISRKVLNGIRSTGHVNASKESAAKLHIASGRISLR
jgi:hypothetical protein